MLTQSIFEVNYLILIVTSIAVLCAILITILFLKQKYENQLKVLSEKLEFTNSTYQNQISNILSNNKKLEEEKRQIKENYEDKIKLIENHHDENIDNISNTYEIKLSNINKSSRDKEESLKKEFEIKESNFTEKINLLQESKDKMKVEFENLANKLFEENQKKSNINLNQVLTSFKDQLDLFGKRVNDIYNEETKQRSSLLTEIKNLKELNNQIATDAVNLTKALKGEKKTQGDWGEMILSSILEQTGLREGIEYSVQGSFSDEHGKRLRPDVIVHLPNKKDIIIDSKVSLNSYLVYCQTDDLDKKEAAAKELIKAINNHIKGLSSKSYESIENVRTLDFVLMFIPVEGAFLLASSKDDTLFKTAFEHNIMLVSPSTLYVTLRTIENIWRNEHQNENAQLIAKKAADLYDKFANFLVDIEDIGVNINRTQKAYDNAMNKLSVGKGNLLKRSEEFLELGVKPKKLINNKALEEN